MLNPPFAGEIKRHPEVERPLLSRDTPTEVMRVTKLTNVRGELRRLLSVVEQYAIWFGYPQDSG